MRALISLFFCVAAASVAIYVYIDAQNALTEVKLMIPQVQKELHELKEENKRLRFEAAQFESPEHLMQLSRKPEFSHLKPCFEKDCVKIFLEGEER